MENETTYFDRAKFDDVWQRVLASGTNPADIGVTANPGNAPGGVDDAAQLRDFMDDEANDAQIYCTLASLCAGSARRELLAIAADERCHLKHLRARYFILTGETYTPPSACPLIYSVSQTLRRKYTGELEGAAAYRSAAAATSDMTLRDIYLAHAEDEARHSKIIGCLIENMM
ncbi:hypothetical protein AAFA46_02265 [Oscillospiraceae bacterium WX1]